jgi:hypothetical protein
MPTFTAKATTHFDPAAILAAVARAASRVLSATSEMVQDQARQIIQGFNPTALVPSTPAELRTLREDAERRHYTVMVPNWEPFPLPPAGPQALVDRLLDAFRIDADWKNGGPTWTVRNTSNLSALYEFGARQTLNVWQLIPTGQLAAFPHAPRNPRKWLYTGRTVTATYPRLAALSRALTQTASRSPTLWANAVTT